MGNIDRLVGMPPRAVERTRAPRGKASDDRASFVAVRDRPVTSFPTVSLGMERKVPDPERVIAQLAAPQRGLVTRRDLVGAGFSSGDVSRRVKSGRLVRVLPGVYLVSAINIDPATFRRAALLAAGTDASLIHRSAGGALGIIDHPVGVVHIGRPGKGRVHRWKSASPLADGKHGYVDVAQASDLADESGVVDGERRTLLPRTLVDLAEHAPR
ncbi:MAG: type IV toxin-antitoxin system AbiEi family antitoxin domain-containing protein, partial [Solirubrobacteraceae bacterium]